MTRELRDAVVVQAEGAQIVARAAAVRPGEVVLDVCAAPGGKTLVLATDLDVARERRSRLVAGDFRPSRVALLGRTLHRAGITAPVVAHDATRALPYRPLFDCVVLDAPCSGLGTLSRDPDLKWSRTERELARFAAVESDMLDEAARVVKPGGRLLYATCSSEPDENEDVVARFLERTPQFAARPLSPGPPLDGMVDAQGFLATRPDRDGIDAFFAAMLVRRPAA
jgi:16S rRNA (cytosine967-C5)-methyltransferase